MRQIRLIRNGQRPDEASTALAGRRAALRSRIARGDYVVDERAVAEAMLSSMLVPAQLFGHGAVRSGQHDPGAGLDGSEPGHR